MWFGSTWQKDRHWKHWKTIKNLRENNDHIILNVVQLATGWEVMRNKWGNVFNFFFCFCHNCEKKQNSLADQMRNSSLRTKDNNEGRIKQQKFLSNKGNNWMVCSNQKNVGMPEKNGHQTEQNWEHQIMTKTEQKNGTLPQKWIGEITCERTI